jgi:hypothetical protein
VYDLGTKRGFQTDDQEIPQVLERVIIEIFNFGIRRQKSSAAFGLQTVPEDN